MTGDMIKVLEGFHHQVARRITGITTTLGPGGGRKYPPLVAAIEAAGLHPIREYIRRRKSAIAE